MISSTSSSSSVAAVGENVEGLYGRTMGPTMPRDVFEGSFNSEGAIGTVDPESSASLAIPASAPEGPTATTVASGIVVDSFPPTLTSCHVQVLPQ